MELLHSVRSRGLAETHVQYSPGSDGHPQVEGAASCSFDLRGGDWRWMAPRGKPRNRVLASMVSASLSHLGTAGSGRAPVLYVRYCVVLAFKPFIECCAVIEFLKFPFPCYGRDKTSSDSPYSRSSTPYFHMSSGQFLCLRGMA